MRKLLQNNNGSIVYGSFIVGLIVLLLFMTVFTLSLNEYIAVQSNIDSLRAYYLAESGTEVSLEKLEDILDEVVIAYLITLKQYKIEYLRETVVSDHVIAPFKPPKLNTFVKNNLNIKMNTVQRSYKNHFSAYSNEHSCNIAIDYNPSNNTITLISVGEYNRSRKFLSLVLEGPVAISDGLDDFHLPKVKIIPYRILSYSQTFGQ